MPMIRFTTSYTYNDLEKLQMSKIVQICMEKYFDTPENDCFHIFEQLNKGEIIVDPNYWVRSPRTEQFILLYITAGKARTSEQKSNLMTQITKKLNEIFNIPEQDIMFILVHNTIEDWCFGHAQRGDIYLKSITDLT